MLLDIFAITALSLSSCAASSSYRTPPVNPVSGVDLQRYQGLWYEYALIPNSFQRRCASDTTAHYRVLSNGKVEVINACQQEDGSKESVIGRAKPTDSTNSKLRVTFVSLFNR